MKFYLASRFEDRFRMREVRRELENIGHIVTSQWLDHGLEVISLDPSKNLAYEADKDLKDVVRADTFILFNEHEGGKGRWVELGVAIGLPKTIIVIGPKNCVFLHIESIYVFESWGEAFVFIRDELS